MKQGGAKANKNGQKFEKFIEDRLKNEDYQYEPANRFIACSLSLEQAIYSKQVKIGKTIYDTNRRCDFIIFHPTKHPNCLVIENKWQESKGSVDEKYPYLVENIKISKYDTIVVIEGEGYKPKALEWLKNQVGGKLINVFSMAEFQKWANNEKNL